MRAYTLTNWMLRPIQQGIQPAHCLIDMFTKYRDVSSIEHEVLYDWANNHKTMICLSAGDYASLVAAWNILEVLGNRLGLPVQKFHEDEGSLGGLMTSIGIIVPERVYTYASALRSRDLVDLAEWYEEHNTNVFTLGEDFVMLAKFLNNFSLAT